MSAEGQHQADAMRMAAWRAAAASEGRPLYHIILDDTRRRLGVNDESRTVAGQAWYDMPDTSRRLLLMLAAPEVDELKARQPWEAFTEGQRRAIGALARVLRRELDQAGRLL